MHKHVHINIFAYIFNFQRYIFHNILLPSLFGTSGLMHLNMIIDIVPKAIGCAFAIVMVVRVILHMNNNTKCPQVSHLATCPLIIPVCAFAVTFFDS